METIQSGPIETIRLSDKEKTKLIWAINQSAHIDLGVDKDRVAVTAENTNAVLLLPEGGGQGKAFSVIAYKHGRFGLSLIHGRYVYPNTKCKLRFQSLNGKWHERVGKTSQCIHVQGLIHAMQVVFDDPINLDEFADLTLEQETQHLNEIAQEAPRKDDNQFAGLMSRVLYVDDQPSDRKLLSHWLKRSQIKVATATSLQSGNEMLDVEPFDLMIVDLHLGHERGIDLISNARGKKFTQPILAVSADENEQLHQAAQSAGANAFLPKPFTEDQIVAAAKELMGFDANSDHSEIHSTLAGEPDMVALLTGYVRSLPPKIEALQEASAKNDYKTLEHLGNVLKGSGTSYGYQDITAAATQLLEVLGGGDADREGIKRSANTLVSTLCRAKAPKKTVCSEGGPQ